ncbi:MAG: hypothetical protein ACYTGH_04765 [Planctomycetota bacterium]|jgi:hypothetical protein
MKNHSVLPFGISLLLALVLAVASSLHAAEPIAAEQRCEMTDRALQYLIGQQKESGQVGESRAKATTALFILATLSSGKLPNDPVYGPGLTRAATWLMESGSGGFLGGVDEPMADHVLAALALSQLVGTFPDTAMNRKVYEQSRQALDYTLDAQDKGSNEDYAGGWRPNPKTRTNDRVLTAWCLLQVEVHRLNQERVSKSAVQRGSDFVLASQKLEKEAGEKNRDRGGFAVGAEGLAVRSTSAAGLLTLALFEGDTERIKAGQSWVGQHPPRWYGPHFFTTNVFACRALWRTRGVDQGATFNRYYSRLTRLLRERQDGNGSMPFPPGHGGPLLSMGDTYSTAMAVLILNVDRGYLPIDQ